MSNDIGIWLGALMTLSIYSMLVKPNPVYELVQNIIVGLASAHAIVTGFDNIKRSALVPAVWEGKWYLFVPVVLGLLLYTRFSRKLSWTSRIPIALLVGSSAAVSIQGALVGDLQKQVRASMMLKWSKPNDAVFLVCLICTLAYFVFAVRVGKKAFTVAGSIGRYVMMAAFGASMAYTVMARMTVLIGRLTFLFGKWVHFLE